MTEQRDQWTPIHQATGISREAFDALPPSERRALAQRYAPLPVEPRRHARIDPTKDELDAIYRLKTPAERMTADRELQAQKQAEARARDVAIAAREQAKAEAEAHAKAQG